MKRAYLWTITLIVLLTILAGCGGQPGPTAGPTLAPGTTARPTSPPDAGKVLYVAIIWHQHQPLYYKDPTTGIYLKPWVRVHAAKDYVDMAALVEQYPKVHVTFNLTPSLLRQLDDIGAGAKDAYWVLTEVPADQLTAEQQIYILQHFFDANHDHIIARFPRYKELLDKRGSDVSADTLQAALANWSTADLRDLQVLFNLAWTDPDWLAAEPLKALVDKGRGFSEEDKAVVLAEHLRLVQEVVPLHKRLQDAGQIEVTMTPYAHPILPLLVNTDLATMAQPDIELPKEKFFYKQDAVAHLQKGVEFYQAHFGQAPRGMWPAEGSVAQDVVGMISEAGIQWMASDEGVVAASLGLPGFTRNSQDTVQEADILYRPYYVQEGSLPPVAMVFRDVVISDKVGFTYSGTPGEEAAQDFVNRLHAIKKQLDDSGATGPHLVSVILDGENAWEYYDNDGKAFLHALYEKLSNDPDLVTVTPSEYLAQFPDQPTIESLWAGSWISHDFTTWIGEEEENTGWTYLKRTRDAVQQYVLGNKTTDPATLDKAMELMYAAEGSDWFWWYGADQNSGDDASFDLQYRSTLMDIYKTLGEEVPDWLYVPIIPAAPALPTKAMAGLVSPTIDGQYTPGEWDKAASYTIPTAEFLSNLVYGFDARNLYLRLDSPQQWAEWLPDAAVEVYLSVPMAETVNSFSRYGAGADPRTLLGFGAAYEVLLRPGDDTVTAELAPAAGKNTWGTATAITTTAASGNILEVAVPLDRLGEFEPGNVVYLRAVVSYKDRDVEIVPAGGVAKVVLPDLGRTTNVLVVSDPPGDDHGPGTYTYPQDGVFAPGNFDIVTFTVGYDDKNLVFQVYLAGPVDNSWGSGNGLSLQTIDIYIDQDGAGGGGARELLPGRNAAFAAGDGWEYVIWAEGWTPGIFKAGADGTPEQVDATFAVIADPAQHKVTIRVPKAALGDTPEQWRYAAVVLGQEGYPAAGVWRVREVAAAAAQWRFGGAPADTNHTRIIDVAWDGTPAQEEFLSSYPASSETNMDSLTPDDFAIIPLRGVSE